MHHVCEVYSKINVFFSIKLSVILCYSVTNLLSFVELCGVVEIIKINYLCTYFNTTQLTKLSVFWSKLFDKYF